MIRIVMALVGLLVCTVMGGLLASCIGVPAWLGAIGMVVIGVGSYFVRLPNGLRAGVYVEVWTRQVVEHYTHALEGTFLEGVPDFSQYAENDVVHLSDVSGDPTVLVDNTTYPLEIEELEDGDVSIKLSKCFSCRVHLSVDEVEQALCELEASGMVVRYEVGQGDVHDQIGLVGLDKGDDFLGLVRIHLCRGDLGGGFGRQLCRQLVALGFSPAGDADLGKDFRHLAALVDGDGSNTAAADDEDFTHGKFLLCWLFYVNVSKCVKPGTRASPCPVRSGAPAAPCRPWRWKRRRGPAWGPAR